MSLFFGQNDADPTLVQSAKVAIIGYGNQGRVHALNLRDSGVSVAIGARDDGNSKYRALDDGFPVKPIAEAVADCNVILLTTPDGPMAQIYAESVHDHLQNHALLLFAHGFNIHYKTITPPPTVDVGMVSPKGQALGVRQKFIEGSGLPALIAVQQDATGNAWARTLSYAWAIGCLRVCAIKSSFRDETECDLFGEQAVLCGGIPDLIRAGFDTLIESGYSPEVAYFECLYETKLIVDLIVERGLAGMRGAISDTAAWGGLEAGRKVISESVRDSMRQVLLDIQSGRFANEWIAENNAGKPTMKQYQMTEANSDIEVVGQLVRKMMQDA